MDTIDNSETRSFRKLLVPLFGMQAMHWAVTQATYEAFGKLVVESRQSLKARTLVPHPSGLASAHKWANRTTRQALLDFFESVEGRSHLQRMKTPAEKMRGSFERARTAPY